MNTHIEPKAAKAPYSRHRWTVEDYHRMGRTGFLSEDDRVELIEGELIEMAPIGSKHADCVDGLNRLLVKQAEAMHRIRIQNPVQLGNDSEPEPDIAIVRNRRYADAHPTPRDILLLIEVADTTMDYDRDIKIPLYARHGVPEVWLVDLRNQCVEVYWEPGAHGYRHLLRPGQNEVLAPKLAPQLTISISEIF
jgi:Uma2 family endonuclease